MWLMINKVKYQSIKVHQFYIKAVHPVYVCVSVFKQQISVCCCCCSCCFRKLKNNKILNVYL